MAVRDKGIHELYTWTLAMLVYSEVYMDDNPLIMCIRDHNVEDDFLGSGRIKHQSISCSHCMARENRIICIGVYTHEICRTYYWFIWIVRIFGAFELVDRRRIDSSKEKLVSVRDAESQYSIEQRGGYSYVHHHYLSAWHIAYDSVVCCLLKLICSRSSDNKASIHLVLKQKM